MEGSLDERRAWLISAKAGKVSAAKWRDIWSVVANAIPGKPDLGI
jgi:hypothetical protein